LEINPFVPMMQYTIFALMAKKESFLELAVKRGKMKRTTAIITGSIARSASRRYLVYSEAGFEVFRPAVATRCTVGGREFCVEEGAAGPSSLPNFTPIGATTRV